MRSFGAAAVLAMAATMPFSAQAGPTCEPDPGPVLADNGTRCVPTPEECATGNYNGVYDPGLGEGRFGVCLAVQGRIVLYAAGNASTPCGAVFINDHMLIGSYSDEIEDPNRCA